MRSNRTIQTIIQALILVLMAAIAFQLPALGRSVSAGATGDRFAPSPPTDAHVKKAFRTYFDEWKKGELPKKADLKELNIKDVSVDGTIAYVKLQIEVKWIAAPVMPYEAGPLKNARGATGEYCVYEEVFPLRFWTRQGWDFEGHVPPPEIR